jgi:small subunit ribosomal protein S20
MANHSSAKKALRQTIKKNLINKSRLSRIKTYIKKTVNAVATGSKDDATAAFIIAQSEIMKGVSKNLLKPNTAARRVSALSRKINNMEALSQ